MKKKLLIALGVVGIAAALFLVQNPQTRSRVSYQGKPVSTWASAFYPSFDPQVTNEAVLAFRAMGSNAVPTLFTMLRAKEPWYSKLFVRQAGNLPSGMRAYLTSKIKPGQSLSKRLSAARALGVVGADAAVAVPELATGLIDPEMRWAAAQALGSIGGPAIPVLASATTNKDANTRHAAVYGLGQAGTNGAMAAGALLDCMFDQNQSVQASAVFSLIQSGRPGLAVVLETLSTNNLPRREAATMAIKAMNTPPRQILNALIEFSTNSSPRLRQNSLEALQGLRSNHPSAIANYFKATADFDAGVRTAAAHALGQANNWNTNPALGNVVAHLLKRESSSLRSNAVETLTGLLSDSAMPVREAAQQSLAALQSSSAN